MQIIERAAIVIPVFRAQNLAGLNEHTGAGGVKARERDLVLRILRKVYLYLAAKALTCEAVYAIIERGFVKTFHLQTGDGVVYAHQLVGFIQGLPMNAGRCAVYIRIVMASMAFMSSS